MEFPGADRVQNPMVDLCYEVEIHARPEKIWPWIKQLGYHRAGWYIDATRLPISTIWLRALYTRRDLLLEERSAGYLCSRSAMRLKPHSLVGGRQKLFRRAFSCSSSPSLSSWTGCTRGRSCRALSSGSKRDPGDAHPPMQWWRWLACFSSGLRTIGISWATVFETLRRRFSRLRCCQEG